MKILKEIFDMKANTSSIYCVKKTYQLELDI